MIRATHIQPRSPTLASIRNWPSEDGTRPVPRDDLETIAPQPDLLRTLVDQLSAMVAYWDSTQRCRFANRAYRRWFGVSPESLIGKHISELLGPLYPLNLPYIEGALRGEPQEFEREIPDPAGGPSRHSLANYFPDIVDGVVRGFFVLVTDISAIKRVELALRESEERFRLTLDEAPIGMALVAPDGRFLRVNRALCEIVGYTADELTGLTFQAITYPDDLDADLELAGRLARGEIPRYQLAKRYLRKDGTGVDIMLSGSALRGADGAPVHFIAQIEDITERKRLEDELRLAEATSSGILSISADAIISIDEQQRISLFNDGAEKIFGYSRAEALGAPLDILIPERYRAFHRQHVARFAAGGTAAYRVEERVRAVFGLRKNGEEFPADAAISNLTIGAEKVLTVAIRDITERKRVEREQRFLAEVGPVLASSLDYQETLSTIASLAVREIADLCIVEVVEADERVRRIKVASRDPSRNWLCELLTRIPLDRSRPHLMSEVQETRRAALLQSPTEETIAALAQGEEHHRALRAAEIRSMVAVPLVAHGRLLGLMAFVSSSPSRLYGESDVRMAEELAQRAALSVENARLYDEARRATQARDDVLGIIAHDLRNPLNSVLMQANLLRSGGAEPGQRARKSADVIERAVRRMDRLIQDLLDVSRMDAGRLSVEAARVDARLIISDCVEAQRTLASSASLELQLDVASSLPEVWADRDRLLQILENLIGNAVKFTRPGGRIVLGAAPREGEVWFWVSDTGSGIAADDVPHLFDRFWQGRKAGRHGAGLGLPIVKGLVEAHGGRIWVESTPGRGSTFFFSLPLPRTPPPGTEEGSAGPRPA
jgi:PAS domain S-box-containing protein